VWLAVVLEALGNVLGEIFLLRSSLGGEYLM